MSVHVSPRYGVARSSVGPTLLVVLAAVVVTGGAWLWAVLAAPAAVRMPVAWGGGVTAVVLCVAAGVAAYCVGLVRRSRDRIAQVGADADRLRSDVHRLSEQTLPAVVKRVRHGALVGAALAEVPHPADGSLQRLLYAVAREVSVGNHRSAAAVGACASAAARVQALTTRILAELRELEDRHSEEKVFADLLELDHRVSQMGRLADNIVVLSGGRSGRRWTKPIPMESILRGAMGRVDAYKRIRVHSTCTDAVVGYAAEGVMHALAELLDNAATFSAQPSVVHIYVEEEDAGVVVTIEDSGLGMRQRERRRAEQTVSEPLDLATMSGTRLGLGVVGRLASKHGLMVSFRPSSRGGTGVVVMVPRQLITQPRQDVAPTPPPVLDAPTAPAPTAAPAAPAAPAEGDEGDEGDEDVGGLPKRRRGETLAAASQAMPPQPVERAHARRDPSTRFAAFRQAGGRGGDRDTNASAEGDAG